MKMTEEQRKTHIAALLTERSQCERQGFEGRVRLIDEQLEFYGHKFPKKKKPEAAIAEPGERVVPQKPRARRGRSL